MINSRNSFGPDSDVFPDAIYLLTAHIFKLHVRMGFVNVLFAYLNLFI